MRYSPYPIKHYVRPGGGPGTRFQFREGCWNLAWLILPGVEDVAGYPGSRMEDDILRYTWAELEQRLKSDYPVPTLRYLFGFDQAGLMLTRHWTQETIDRMAARAQEAEERLRAEHGFVLPHQAAANVVSVDFANRRRI